MNSEGYFVNDCHAEVLARRSLIRYLTLNLSSKELFDECSNGKKELRENIRFHLYISEPPCGDASMLQFGEDMSHWTGAKSLDKCSS